MHSKHTRDSITKDNQLILYREIIAICFDIHTKHGNTTCGKGVEILCIERGVIYRSHCALKGKIKFLFDKLNYTLVILRVAVLSSTLC
jgi:hypothetical protein